MQYPNEKEDSKAVSGEKAIPLLSLGSLIVGSVGYFSLQSDLWIFYFFAHLGALGIMGLFGGAAGSLARKKHRSYWQAFSLGFLLPIISGIVAVLIFLLVVSGRLHCGGSVSLVVAIVTVIFYLLAKKKTPPEAGHAG